MAPSQIVIMARDPWRELNHFQQLADLDNPEMTQTALPSPAEYMSYTSSALVTIESTSARPS